MPVFVDDLSEWPGSIPPAARRHGRTWCHLWCDPGQEAALHALAARIGLRRSWFQARPGFPHYDLTPGKRRLALAAGAVPTSLANWIAGRTETKNREKGV